MSRATEWAQRENETPEQWLRRLERAYGDGVSARDKFIFNVRLRQATAAARGRKTDAQPGAQQRPGQIPEEPPAERARDTDSALNDEALARAREAFLKLGPRERSLFSLWLM